jgi:hypothetical protein
MLAIPSPIITKNYPAHGSLPSRNKPVPLELIRDPPDLGINVPNLCLMSLGPSSVLRVLCCDPRFAFSGPWSGAQAAMHPAPVPICHDGILAGRIFAGFSEAPLARPFGPEPRTTARFNELFPVS